jgi:hypothetical protein
MARTIELDSPKRSTNAGTAGTAPQRTTFTGGKKKTTPSSSKSGSTRSLKKALRLRNFNLGIAAVAYMRRVVENRMNDMLEILHEAARAHNLPGELLVRHEEIKKERRFSTKIEYAGDLLPQNIRPQGQPNPMAVLHELASEGLHTKTDEECVDIFDECRQTFEYVFGKMRIETAQANDFVKGIARLAEKRTKAGEANKK